MSEVEDIQRLSQNIASNSDINDMDSMRPNERQDLGKVLTSVDFPQVCRQTLDTGFLFAHNGNTLAGVLADGSQAGIGEWRHIIDL